VARPLNLLLGEPLHFLMQTLQFQNLHKRVKAETPPTSARHSIQGFGTASSSGSALRKGPGGVGLCALSQ
jgi:hypothetical protein